MTAGEQWVPLWVDGWLPSTPTSFQGVSESSRPQTCFSSMHPTCQIFFLPRGGSGADENHLRAFRVLHAGVELMGGKSQKTLRVSPLSLIRAPLTALETVPRRPEWAGKRHGLSAHRKLF